MFGDELRDRKWNSKRSKEMHNSSMKKDNHEEGKTSEERNCRI